MPKLFQKSPAPRLPRLVAPPDDERLPDQVPPEAAPPAPVPAAGPVFGDTPPISGEASGGTRSAAAAEQQSAAKGGRPGRRRPTLAASREDDVEPGVGRKIYLPDELHKRLRLEAIERRVKVSTIAVEILDRHLPRFEVRRVSA